VRRLAADPNTPTYRSSARPLSLSFDATAAGDAYAVSVPATVTEDVASGTYRWVARLTLSGTVYDVASGTVVVTPNLAVETAFGPAHARERMLAAIEAELIARGNGDGSAHVAYGIGGRSIQKMTLDELEKARAKCAAEMTRQRNGGKLPPVYVRFGSV
jgi:hypothetical protein